MSHLTESFLPSAFRLGLLMTVALTTAACTDPGSRAPTDEELLSAVKYAVSGGDGHSVSINNPISGATIEVKSFENLGCEKAGGAPGYVCDYLIELSFKLHSNEGTAAGQQHANALNAIMSGIQAMQNAGGPRPQRARFAYSTSRERWMKMD
jgi:hypothetical protein